jgi:hypothetical protein
VFGFGQEVVIEGVGASVLEHQVYFALSFDHIEQFGDGGVRQFGKNVYLSL